MLDEAGGAGGTVVISAIGGTAGIGKTTLAVTWAHQVADRFPDGQLYVNLRGFDPAGAPMDPGEAVWGFLDAFGVPTERIPVSLDAKASLYRSLLADRRVLVILDNARDANQVRPLLPGAPGCVAVITSRNQLTSLITALSAHCLMLDLLTRAEARQLLIGRLGPGRVAAEPLATEEIITLCARLPLALAIVAARAATHPGFPLEALARELCESRGGLEAFGGGEVAADARAVFSWSYHQLSTSAARLFRLLGLHPGPDATASAAASLVGEPVGQVRPWLAELARANLLAEHAPGRFTFHDLLRAYASEQAHAHDPAAQRRDALHRMLDHYLHTARAAAARMHPGREQITLAPPRAGVALREFADYAAAWAWFEAEYPVLLGAIQLAATGADTHAWQLPWTMLDFFERQGHWHDWAATHHTALDIARRHGNHDGQAWAHFGLGRACRWLGRPDDAYAHLRQALRLLEQFGDQLGQAQAHLFLGEAFEGQGRLQESLSHAQQALAFSQAARYRRGQPNALNKIGWYHALLGDAHQALAYCQQALDLYRELGDPRGQANTLDSIGYAYYRLGHLQMAIAYFEQSVTLQERGDRHGQATHLTHLGDAHYATGDLRAARDAWQEALDILDDLDLIPGGPMGVGYPNANQVRTKLVST